MYEKSSQSSALPSKPLGGAKGLVPVEDRLVPLEAIDVVVDQPLSLEDPRQILKQKEVALSPTRARGNC